MIDADRQDMVAVYAVLATQVKHFSIARILGAKPLVRIVPGPSGASALVLARIRYELTGQRQWIVPPTVELLN